MDDADASGSGSDGFCCCPSCLLPLLVGAEHSSFAMLHLPLLCSLFIYYPVKATSTSTTDSFIETGPWPTTWSGVPDGTLHHTEWSSFFNHSTEHGITTTTTSSTTTNSSSSSYVTDSTTSSSSTSRTIQVSSLTSTSTHVSTQSLVVDETTVGTSTGSISSSHAANSTTSVADKSLNVTTTSSTSTSQSTPAHPLTPASALATTPGATVSSPLPTETAVAVAAISSHPLSTTQIVLIVLGIIFAFIIVPPAILILLRGRSNSQRPRFIADLMVETHPSRVISPFISTHVDAELASPVAQSVLENVSDPFASNFAFVPEKHRAVFESALAVEEEPQSGCAFVPGQETHSENQHPKHITNVLSVQEQYQYPENEKHGATFEIAPSNPFEEPEQYPEQDLTSPTTSTRVRPGTLISTTSTARQAILQNQAEFIQDMISLLQQSADPSAAEEIPQLQMSLREVLDQMDSEWALGFSDDPPPMYYWQTPPPSARFAPTPSLRRLSRRSSLSPSAHFVPPEIRVHPPSVHLNSLDRV